MRLTNELCKTQQLRACHLVGSGTAGLFLAIRALGISGKGIAIPNGVCPNVPLAVLLSGNVPVYLDISQRTLGLSRESLAASKEEFAAVIAVHAYGYVCEVDELGIYCQSRGIPLIEDIAVAQGASYGGRPLGGFSDISILSFGAGKIIDAGIGGAVMSDDPGLIANVAALDSELGCADPDQHAIAHQVGQLHTQMYNQFYEKQPAALHRFGSIALAERAAFLHRFPENREADILAKLYDLPRRIEERQKKAAILECSLENIASTALPLVPPDGSVIWRFNLLIDRGRDDLLRHLLAKRYMVSSWYPPVDIFFRNREHAESPTPICDEVGRRILNLWVNQEAESSYLNSIATEIVNFVRARNS